MQALRFFRAKQTNEGGKIQIRFLLQGFKPHSPRHLER